MALTRLKLNQFTVFDDAEFEFCSGINVFIGKNSTGKSHALKVMYALLRGLKQSSEEQASESRRDKLIAERLTRIFLPDELDRLIRRPALEPERGAELLLTGDNGSDAAVILKDGITTMGPTTFQPPTPLYIPSRDVLAISEGFIRLYEKREISFDETYVDLCRALEDVPLRQPPEILGQIESVLGGKVEQKQGGRFYIKIGGEEFEAHLVGEGLRKIAIVVRLIANGVLTKGSVLFWDEPEAGLNPQMIAEVSGFIRGLAAWGVQIFIATHDYLLSNRLSLAAGSGVAPQVPTRFFSLHRAAANDPIEVEEGSTLEELQNNPIVRAHTEYYAYQRKLFAQGNGAGT